VLAVKITGRRLSLFHMVHGGKMIYTGMKVRGFTVLNLTSSIYHVTELLGCSESGQ